MNSEIDVRQGQLVRVGKELHSTETYPDTLDWWLDQYLNYEISTSPSSRQVQAYDISLFIKFMNDVEGNINRIKWTPRLSRDYVEYLRNEKQENGKRRWSDNTISRILAHLKTFSKWIHKWKNFPLGNPLDKVKLISPGVNLDIERAINEVERRRILDAADMLPNTGGISKDRNRYKKKERPRRKTYRPWRNRAIVYALVETGMRRVGLVNLELEGLDPNNNTVTTREKGGLEHTYEISKDGMAAIQGYITYERPKDNKRWKTNALFIAAENTSKGKGRLDVMAVNRIWNEVCKAAGVIGKSPHSCRHGMGRYLMEKTGNPAAVQHQLGHRNASYSLQYARVTRKEISKMLEERN